MAVSEILKNVRSRNSSLVLIDSHRESVTENLKLLSDARNELLQRSSAPEVLMFAEEIKNAQMNAFVEGDLGPEEFSEIERLRRISMELPTP